MGTRTKTLGPAVVLWLACAPLAAQTTGREADTGDPVLEALVAEALTKSPDVQSASRLASAAAERIAPARTLPDPFLSFNYQNDGRGFTLGERDMTFLGAMISQPLPWPGKLRLAGEIARDDAREIEQALPGRGRLGVEARVRRAYVEWSLSNRLLDLIEERSQTWRQIEAVVRERYATGLAVQQDLLRAQAELLRIDEERADEEARLRSRLAGVNRAVGRPQETPIEGRGSLPETAEGSLALSQLLEASRSRSPELAALAVQLEADRARLALARKNRLPDFVASAGPMYRGGLDPMWQVGLGITLPINAGSRQKPQIREADLRQDADLARLSAATQELDLRTRERFEALGAAARVARLYREGILPVDRLSLDAALASYKTGKVPFVTVLDALNVFYADRAAYLTRLAEAAGLRIAIDEADLVSGAAMSPGSLRENAGAAMSRSSTGSSSPMR